MSQTDRQISEEADHQKETQRNTERMGMQGDDNSEKKSVESCPEAMAEVGVCDPEPTKWQ